MWLILSTYLPFIIIALSLWFVVGYHPKNSVLQIIVGGIALGFGLAFFRASSEAPVPVSSPVTVEAKDNNFEEAYIAIQSAYLHTREAYQNEDIRGYLHIDGIVSEPLLFDAKDQERYLHINPGKVKDPHGSLVIGNYSMPNEGATGDYGAFMVYGHNNADDSKFGLLDNYLTPENLALFPDIYVGTDNGVTRYQVAFVSPAMDAIEFVKQKEFNSSNEAIQQHQAWKDKAIAVNPNFKEQVGAKMLALQTCVNYWGDERYIFFAAPVEYIGEVP